MLKTRIQLVLIALAILVLDILSLSSNDNDRFLNSLFLSVIFFAPVFLIWCTYKNAKEKADGSICFLEGNPLVNWGFVGEKKISLCPIFWVTFIAFWFMALAILLVGIVVYGIFLGVTEMSARDIRDIKEGLNSVDVWLSENVLLILETIISFLIIGFILCGLAKKIKGFATVLIVVAAVFFFGFVLGYIPLLAISEKYNIPLEGGGWWDALGIYFLNAILLFGSIAIVALGLYFLFRNWARLRKSWFGKLVNWLREKLCTEFTVCPEALEALRAKNISEEQTPPQEPAQA